MKAGNKQEGGLLPFLSATLILKAITKKGVTRAGIRQNEFNLKDKILSPDSFFSQYRNY